MRLIFIEYLLWSSSGRSFYPYSFIMCDRVSVLLCIIPFYRWENWGSVTWLALATSGDGFNLCLLWLQSTELPGSMEYNPQLDFSSGAIKAGFSETRVVLTGVFVLSQPDCPSIHKPSFMNCTYCLYGDSWKAVLLLRLMFQCISSSGHISSHGSHVIWAKVFKHAYLLIMLLQTDKHNLLDRLDLKFIYYWNRTEISWFPGFAWSLVVLIYYPL